MTLTPTPPQNESAEADARSLGAVPRQVPRPSPRWMQWVKSVVCGTLLASLLILIHVVWLGATFPKVQPGESVDSVRARLGTPAEVFGPNEIIPYDGSYVFGEAGKRGTVKLAPVKNKGWAYFHGAGCLVLYIGADNKVEQVFVGGT